MSIGLGTTIIGSLGNLGGANNSTSDSWGNSWGSASASGYTNSDAWAKANGWSASGSESNEYGESSSNGENYSRVYGAEASAQDILRAAEANQVQRSMWQDQADFNAKQAQIDREFQAQMSNTAYQRAVRDLLSAGLNPILAVGNMGASTPVGAMASSGLATANKAQTFADSESYGSSASSSYNRGSSSSWSKSEESSQSKSKTRSKNQSSSSNGSTEGSHSQSTTQLKELLGAISDLLPENSASSAAQGAGKNAKDWSTGTAGSKKADDTRGQKWKDKKSDWYQ